MATTILRPTSTTSYTGFNANPLPAIGDNNGATSVSQNNVTCNALMVLEDLDSSLSGATINSFTISMSANAGRAGACSVEMALVHSVDGVFAGETESWTGTVSTQTTTARTTQQDGSSALTYAYINNCSVKIVPNTQGVNPYDLWVTVDYTEGFKHKVLGVAAGSIGKITGINKSSVKKLIGK